MNNVEDESLDEMVYKNPIGVHTFRQSLHYQRVLNGVSGRFDNYFEDYYRQQEKYNPGKTLHSDLRVLKQKCILEVRDVLTKYVDLWKKHDEDCGDAQRFIDTTSTKIQIYKDKIKSLEDRLHQTQKIKNQYAMNHELIQESWEREKKMLRQEWEAENAIETHEMMKKLLEDCSIREQGYARKVEHQKKMEIEKIKASLEIQKKFELELEKNKISLKFKARMVRGNYDATIQYEDSRQNLQDSYEHVICDSKNTI